MSLIEEIHAREILDSRGNPTVEAEVMLIGAKLDEPPFLPALPLVSMKLSNYATTIRRVMPVKAF